MSVLKIEALKNNPQNYYHVWNNNQFFNFIACQSYSCIHFFLCPSLLRHLCFFFSSFFPSLLIYTNYNVNTYKFIVCPLSICFNSHLSWSFLKCGSDGHMLPTVFQCSDLCIPTKQLSSFHLKNDALPAEVKDAV